MTYYGSDNLAGGRTSYGCVAGILSLHSTAPRLPGDPVHAQTFDFPVCHAVVEDVTIGDLIALDSRNMGKIITVAQSLENRGVRFIATSCGLFAPFQKVIGEQLRVPFLSSALQIVTFLKGLWPANATVCVFTAHSGLLQEEHLRESGFGLGSLPESRSRVRLTWIRRSCARRCVPRPPMSGARALASTWQCSSVRASSPFAVRSSRRSVYRCSTSSTSSSCSLPPTDCDRFRQPTFERTGIWTAGAGSNATVDASRTREPVR
jgi:hypothetical protein